MQLSKVFSWLAAVSLTLAALAADAAAAPDGHVTPHVRTARQLAVSETSTSLEKCTSAGFTRDVSDRLARRRLETVAQLRNELQRRRRLASSDDVLNKSHYVNDTELVASARKSVSSIDSKRLFGSTPKCVLQPQVTEGPYYVQGELIRTDIRESQPGVDLYAEIQVIDTTTCEPIQDLYVDVWHANAMGAYSDVATSDNRDVSNANTTFGRGLAPTNADGIVQFTTKFPGHYAGRANHINVMGNYNGSVLANQTYAGSNVVNVGQIFFDWDLVNAVEETLPYVANDAILTKNCVDNIYAQSINGGFDPVVNYVYLGEKVEDGIFSWITIGVNSTASKEVHAAAVLSPVAGVPSPDDVPPVGRGDGKRGRGRDHERDRNPELDRGHGHGPGPNDTTPKAPSPNDTVPKAPGPQVDERNTTTRTAIDVDEPKARSGIFSFFFFVISAAALAAFLYKFPTKKNPRRMYSPVTTPEN